ncbi:MAG: acyl-CoA dehydrogenase family protein [Sphingomonadales bacterium]
MADRSFLDWPFFDDAHRALAKEIDLWAAREIGLSSHHNADIDGACKRLVSKLGESGWLRACVPASHGGLTGTLDVRSLCLIRETLARYSGLADFSFAMQGLGSGPITLAGSNALKDEYLPDVRDGKKIAAFALSEPNAGSDVAAIATTAEIDGETDGDDYVLNGEKTWTSNGGIADFYCVFARTGRGAGARGLSAFVVDADTPGLEIVERIDVIAPHPLARIRFTGCRAPRSRMLGQPGQGFRIAMTTLDIFRSTVAAAALGFARRALDEALARIDEREAFGRKLADFQLTKAKIADMATGVDASALLVYRAAWTRDRKADRVTREASMAKMHATETAQQVIDHAVQLFGGQGVVSGVKVEELYRGIRALRIYEGTTEINKLVIADQTMRGFTPR